MKNKNIKILVVYHKKDKLYKNDVLVPIHAGRALALESSKDGKLSQDDYEWLLKNTIGDDTGDNISHLNRELNELTAIYWAWQNYDKLGNPDYIGLNHYRRFFFLGYSKLSQILKDYDFVKLGFYWNQKISIYDAWIECTKSWTDNEYLDNALRLCGEITGNSDIEEYFKTGYERDSYCNMFILSREDFFEYCEFLFNILLQLPSNNGERTKAMFAERLTAYYLKKLEKNKKCLNVSMVSKPFNYLFLAKMYAFFEKFFRKLHLVWRISCS